MHDELFMQIKERGRDGLQARFEHVCRESHQPCYHDNTSLWNSAGFLDLWIPRTKRLDVIELKAMNGRLSPEQRVWIEALEQCESINVRVIRPDEYEAYRDELWEDWLARREAGGHDPITRLYDVIREERQKRKVQSRARKTGQIALGARGGRRTWTRTQG